MGMIHPFLAEIRSVHCHSLSSALTIFHVFSLDDFYLAKVQCSCSILQL
jgi:hypothetical protein